MGTSEPGSESTVPGGGDGYLGASGLPGVSVPMPEMIYLQEHRQGVWAAKRGLFQSPRTDCGICPVINEKIDLFLGPSVPDYVDFVSKYKNNSATLENAKNLKICVDNKLTEEDKANVQSLVDKINANAFC
ncbi:major allergen I polypeptide chain 1-like [Arvicola amphibius]|uniref:major allergen I polypeptide chain 1-like n=1 Tax=Arvicola amphibius TaxID=1047088 RepID=UPI0018E36C34|nr:major allergen I polypeptide chain 1-like [Arvicola amphibius]XP_038196078.1 major allergen I polypeptide chain 1-like [Arvicola amphibius]XP_038196079.1 major allergen I polypeptide chain 1-like [Arvicola amphibius]